MGRKNSVTHTGFRFHFSYRLYLIRLCFIGTKQYYISGRVWNLHSLVNYDNARLCIKYSVCWRQGGLETHLAAPSQGSPRIRACVNLLLKLKCLPSRFCRIWKTAPNDRRTLRPQIDPNWNWTWINMNLHPAIDSPEPTDELFDLSWLKGINWRCHERQQAYRCSSLQRGWAWIIGLFQPLRCSSEDLVGFQFSLNIIAITGILWKASKPLQQLCSRLRYKSKNVTRYPLN